MSILLSSFIPVLLEYVLFYECQCFNHITLIFCHFRSCSKLLPESGDCLFKQERQLFDWDEHFSQWFCLNWIWQKRTCLPVAGIFFHLPWNDIYFSPYEEFDIDTFEAVVFHCNNAFQMVVNSRLWPSSPTVPVSPEHPSGPRSIYPAHLLSPLVSSAERAARPPAGKGPSERMSGTQLKLCFQIFLMYLRKMNGIFADNK